MPTSIPYDPSLVLGSIVDQDTISNILKIAIAQSPIDAAEDNLNSYISMKRSLQMTVNEILNMGIDPTPVIQQMGDVDKALADAAAGYAKASMDGQKTIQQLRSQIASVHEAMESPIDYVSSKILPLPIAADSIKMDVQYFHFEREDQSAAQTIAQIQSFVSESNSVLGSGRSMDMSAAATSQVSQQREYHDIEGTLVFSVVCTHKIAQVFAPLNIDVDKAIRVWNRSPFQQKIKTDDPASMAEIAATEGTGKEEAMNIISGAAYGSSFIGMVHILNRSSTTSSQEMVTQNFNFQEVTRTMDLGAWFSASRGGFGVSEQFSANVQSLLSQQNVQAHVTLLSMGIIPSIKSNDLQLAVNKFTNFSPDQMMGQLQALANSSAGGGGNDTLASAARDARTGQQMVELKNAQIQGTMAAIGKGDVTKDKVIDISSMMTALDDYVQQATGASGKSVGVPINYYIKPITAAQLAEMWVAKYYPGQYMAISGDDSKPAAALPAGGSK